MSRILILGLGYTARAFLQKYKGSDLKIITASRSSEADIQFDFQKESTWNELPEADACIVTFALSQIELSKKFIKHLNGISKRVVVIGTTGSIEVKYDNQVVNEVSPLSRDTERVSSEEQFREMGANIVRAAGIYGTNRDPRNWVMKGLVGPEERYVNFIHVDDLCQFLLAACNSSESGKNFIASDNSPQKWSDLIEQWKREYNLVTPPEHKKSKRTSKQIDSTESAKVLQVEVQYKNVHEGLCEIGF